MRSTGKIMSHGTELHPNRLVRMYEKHDHEVLWKSPQYSSSISSWSLKDKGKRKTTESNQDDVQKVQFIPGHPRQGNYGLCSKQDLH